MINQNIKNLVSGVSQQPPILRRPEQLEVQLNGFSTESGGLQKRPPSLFINSLDRYAKGNKPMVHFIDRDTKEKYCVIFTGSEIFVYDLNGKSYKVNYKEDKSYIYTNSPRDYLRVITIADYTFIANTTKVAKMANARAIDYWANQGLLVNIKSGQYGRTYSISINGSDVASYESPDGSQSAHSKKIATDYIAEELAKQCREKGYTVTTGASWLYVTSSTTINTFVIKDGYNNQAAFGFHKTTQKFSNLPATAPDGFVVLVKGEEGSETDDYYIQYSAKDQVWKETVKPGILCAFDRATMPHVLVREANGSFTFKQADWSDREIGDDDSNPEPSFIGETINDIFYHRNRLGVLAGENVILTRSADFFNFWMTSATKVQDTDPIDLAASDNTISTLYAAVPYDGDLIIFSKEAQFSLSANGLLTPKDAALSSALTHYQANLKAQPVNAGRNIYFTANRAKYTTVREFFTAADNTEAKDVQDITSHVPNYIPNGVYKIIPSTTENMFLLLTEGEEQSVFVYKYLFLDGQRVQASWSKWDFQDNIFGAGFIDDTLYLVISRKGILCLEKVSFTFNTVDYDNEPYRCLMDSKITYTIPEGRYDDLNNITSIYIRDIYGSVYDDTKQYAAVMGDGTLILGNEDDYFVIEGDHTGKTITVGILYKFEIVMSTIMVKQSDDSGTNAMTDGRLQLRQMWFNYADSGYFKVSVTNEDKRNYEYLFTSRLLGTKFNILAAMPFTTGSFRFPIQMKNDRCQIKLETNMPLPISLVGAGWVGQYLRRSQLI